MADEKDIAPATPVTNIEELYPDQDFREMVEAGVFYGRKKSRTHPRMKPYILTNRSGMEIINLAKTSEVMEKASAFLRDKVRSGALILFVATQPAADGAVALAKEYGYPYVDGRWLGGTLTNFKIITKRIEYYKKLKADWGTSALDKYTKKERLMIEKELERLTELMSGLENLTDRPALLVVVDGNLHATAVHEARLLKIPVIAFTNTDSDPDVVDFSIVGNNKARLAVSWFVGKLRTVIAEGKAEAKALAAEKAAASEGAPAKADAPAAAPKKGA